MTGADMVIVALLGALVVFSVVYNARKKKQSCCGCTSSACRVGGCAGCTVHSKGKK